MVADCRLCITMLGESGVGKSSLVLRYCKKMFKMDHSHTAIDYYSKQLVLRKKEIELEIWDTAGQERFRSVMREYFRKADGVLLVYDMTNITTFHKLSSWLEELRNVNEAVSVVIVGNKSDLPHLAAVTGTTVSAYAQNEGLEYYEASAKNNENVDKIFEHLALKILERKCISPFCVEIYDAVSPSQILPDDVSTDDTNSIESLPDIVPVSNDVIKLTVEEPKKKKQSCC